MVHLSLSPVSLTSGIPLQPTFRFAPSPNGELHLGHAFSALLNQRLADAAGGRLLLRIEDIDTTRCKPQLEAQMLDDLHWLGVVWEGTPRRQSEHFARYAAALDQLKRQGFAYPSFMSRAEIKRAITTDWPTDPDGAPLYPGDERDWSRDQIEDALASGRQAIWRLNMAAAMDRLDGPLTWHEGEAGETITADPAAWGDVVLARADTPTSYHLSVTVDDALQQVTHVVRGRDLYHATAVHCLLQHLLDLPQPAYHHHRLILDDEGEKLSKRHASKSLRSLRADGWTVRDMRRQLGFD